MSLKKSIRRILRETKEEKIRNFVYSKFDNLFDSLKLEVEYGENNYVYGRWFDKDGEKVFDRNHWGTFWINKCEPYIKLRLYTKAINLNFDQFTKILLEYLNYKYSDKFKSRPFHSVGDENWCIDDEDNLLLI